MPNQHASALPATRFVYLASLLALLLVLAGCGSLPGVSLGGSPVTPAEPPKDSPQAPPGTGGPSTGGLSTREVLVYYTGPEGKIPGSEGVLRAHADKLSYISGFWYQIDAQNVTNVVPMANMPTAEIKRTVALAHSLGVKVEALFHNLLYGSGAVSSAVLTKLLADPGQAAKLAENLARLAEEMQFDGINIDIEWVAPKSRQAFTQFVKVVTERLHKDNLRVSISVPAKTWDDPQNGWAGGYDYAALGALVDRMVLMTYDEHGYSSPTDGPIASIGWVRNVVKYATREVPAQKLLVGLAAYGFDWTSAKSAPVYLDNKSAMDSVRNGKAKLEWDEASQTPKYKYSESGVTHKVWFENAASSTWKLDLVKEYGLQGFALWRAGMEDPALWPVVGQKMRAAK